MPGRIVQRNVTSGELSSSDRGPLCLLLLCFVRLVWKYTISIFYFFVWGLLISLTHHSSVSSRLVVDEQWEGRKWIQYYMILLWWGESYSHTSTTTMLRFWKGEKLIHYGAMGPLYCTLSLWCHVEHSVWISPLQRVILQLVEISPTIWRNIVYL